ncbi:hypothetical protein [Burkholderia lata]|uniref:Uncharacterized protein n=1 Tax=Burkholderia lata (strain ATCC 17760 / DSM 23089 / LMG 22485 / NCIMB 9086 / R18194 / 383) TaxID=482957 RepID=A0A6P2GSX0_BURL3|nr:hypothetical protein [Burkholderia lata]VWB07636.1 hypothetical protein BLA6863_00178 [Burkholderia lata]
MNCKPGDLAYVTYATQFQNIGRVIEVIRKSSDGDYGPEWVCRSSGIVVAWDEFLQKNLEAPAGTEFMAPDAHLRPITGLPITDDIKDEVTA